MNKFAMLHSAIRDGLKLDDCRVYATLLSLSKKGVVRASLGALTKASGVHRFSVQRSIASLSERMLISVEKTGTTKPSSYVITGIKLSARERTALSAREPQVSDFCAYKERARARKALGASPCKSTSAGFASVGGKS